MIVRQARRLVGELRTLAHSTTVGTFARYVVSLLVHSCAVIKRQSLRPADIGVGNATCTFVIDGSIKLKIPGEYVGLAREIIAKNVYDWPPAFGIRAADVVVDLGANVGIFSLYAAAHGASVVSVEAQDGFLPLLSELFQSNHLALPRTVHALMGSASGVFKDTKSRDAASHWGTEPRCLSLSQLLDEAGAPVVNMLKVDIEGSEFDMVLTSDIQTLRRIERIAMEVHVEHGDVNELVAYLNDAGFDASLADGQLRPVARLPGPFGFLYAQQRGIDKS